MFQGKCGFCGKKHTEHDFEEQPDIRFVRCIMCGHLWDTTKPFREKDIV